MSRVLEVSDAAEEKDESPQLDSKYRLIIVAAQRSKQLQRGARPRVALDPLKHKPTRIALEEVERGKVGFSVVDSVKS
ncbi:MAG TPA: DNA-directed RNA polymerase subunit omega [Pyrinomonadaceae bacterium]|nr:DNA-directed RNA polymerase subunit omega [Pyrinomonadaceae bacterium]